jgi:medium-chain acyl-[acyl-carrier-protein] hydrolase
MNLPQAEEARCRLFCFSPAGRGASIYARWARYFAPEIAICPVQLPGRENRLREKSHRSISTLLEAMAPEIQSKMDLPYAFFGHSMGALVGFELARMLVRQNLPEPVHLFVSAHRAPHLADPSPPISHLPEDDFIREVQRRYQGIPESLLSDPEMKEIILGALKADFSILENYVFEEEPALPCRFSVLGGTRDPEVSEKELMAWMKHCSADVQLRMFPGDHFFIISNVDEVMPAVKSALMESCSRKAT